MKMKTLQQGALFGLASDVWENAKNIFWSLPWTNEFYVQFKEESGINKGKNNTFLIYRPVGIVFTHHSLWVETSILYAHISGGSTINASILALCKRGLRFSKLISKILNKINKVEYLYHFLMELRTIFHKSMVSS